MIRFGTVRLKLKIWLNSPNVVTSMHVAPFQNVNVVADIPETTITYSTFLFCMINFFVSKAASFSSRRVF
jgi:hypothetical protein